MQGKNIEGMANLIRQAKEDPKFFHNLVWKTEETLGSVGFLSREEKAAILRINPEDLVVGLATGRFSPGSLAENCGASCGGSCGGSCGVSCGGSCGVSCGVSCATSSLRTDPGSLVINPAEIGERVQAEINQRFASFMR
ncbi:MULTISPECIES: hypothetical protein [unclassified Sphingomonas]|jgi:hypothetical protein|uniref:hypothetical protein n=1 Tax=unclassified Sphingomonas TaxID=196159 RepID=UPI0008306591|nr:MULTISPECIES: hypothetical protein [unclassified Sphingomonas]MCH4892590.1 hypothetical protein [Sphingomonas sp. SFZ2018-12]